MSASPVFEGDFFSDSVIADPLAAYRQMRETGPIVWLPENNVWAAVAYQPCLEILRKPKLFLSGRGLSLNDEVNNILIGSTLHSDADRHRRQRSITATAIMPDALTSLAPAIERAADDVAEAVCSAGRFDAVAEFASILPLSIVVDLVGLPAHGKARMLEWAAATFNLFEGFNERSRASFQGLRELRDFLNEFGKPEKMQHGGLARRIFDEAPGKGVAPDEAAQMLRDYIAPSLDTTISAAAFLAWHFSDAPDQWQLVREDESLVANAVEEVVRLTTPIRAFSRYVAEDVEMHGVSMKQGQRVLVVYASANRDETVFPRRRQVRCHPQDAPASGVWPGTAHVHGHASGTAGAACAGARHGGTCHKLASGRCAANSHEQHHQGILLPADARRTGLSRRPVLLVRCGAGLRDVLRRPLLPADHPRPMWCRAPLPAC